MGHRESVIRAGLAAPVGRRRAVRPIAAARSDQMHAACRPRPPCSRVPSRESPCTPVNIPPIYIHYVSELSNKPPILDSVSCSTGRRPRGEENRGGSSGDLANELLVTIVTRAFPSWRGLLTACQPPWYNKNPLGREGVWGNQRRAFPKKCLRWPSSLRVQPRFPFSPG